jgi:hypothetical protein
MKKDEIIRRYGEAAYEKKLEQNCERNRKYTEENPEQVIANNQRSNHEQSRKGGKHYAKKLEDDQTGLRGERQKIRMEHGKQYRPYKAIIAPESQIHHEWIPRTSEYRGIALVEADAHMHGFVNVIEILKGKITLLTEEQVRNVRREAEGL